MQARRSGGPVTGGEPARDPDAVPSPAVAMLEVTTRSGRVVVRASDVATAQVTRGAGTIGHDGVVSSPPHAAIEIDCPPGTDVVIGSVSGSVTCLGRLGRVAVTTASGRVEIEHGAEVDVRTSSGRVAIGRSDRPCTVVTTSGRVTIGRAPAVRATNTSGRVEVDSTTDATVRSASGRISIGASGGGRVVVEAISGRVEVTLPAGCRPATQLRSATGRISAGDVTGGSEADGFVGVETLSGGITVRRR